ncbi:FMN-dependent NADH-azoreductase [Bacillus cytotoxicus]|uniref:FMN dependent NADH:quinone oxidoreductase n=1 Tax=Bacillus cytotoxicus TaxID=580165 RepID=A0AAX2CGC8_9BACI|nr:MULTISPECIES: FMN-dependent NADH-azoreductase [Bacillus cereus group]MDH2880181.1 FMN-dependent NADH-azoreductase [Bacillus cytotoxicus]QTR72667.1 FMN-dependent NADH-azoreductase [Bacillus cytotoxicus]QTR77832.1 FMN-dependent NADH-azoreductase [Bacillus cytotoxicus]QTR82350.1 FMN-dependent NADH-azoreductase [Bacillus cytotoxicus]QTR86088.1 FMN-dependent NADH-azoreductase [Bacillus cytotoxicus]
MTKVLFITANPNSAETSFGMAVGEAFIEAYKNENPQHEVITIDLFHTTVPVIDADVFAAWGKFAAGEGFEALTENQQQKIAAMNTNLEIFMNADRYVFVTPMWNFGYPPVMKAYLDNIAIAGKTFKYTENGPVGLLEGKKALHIQATGGIYSEGDYAAVDFGRQHLNTVLGFIGVSDTEYLAVEGMNANPEKAQEIKEAAIAKARELAKRF